MEDNTTQDHNPSESDLKKGCINCGNPEILNGFPNDLCSECRNKFIKFPIPIWIKLFAAGIGILMLFSLVTLPQNLSTGIAFEKGIRAEEENKYFTAQHQMESVLKIVPEYKEAKAHLLIASFYNSDIETFTTMASQLGGQNLDDEMLFNKVIDLLAASDDYFPSDSLYALIGKYPDTTAGNLDTILLRFIHENPKDIFAKTEYAGLLYNRNKYLECDSIYESILKDNGNYLPALTMIAGLKRIEGDTKSSLDYCDKLLLINKESPFALSCKARTLLKMKKEKEALELALKSASFDGKDPYSISTLALAYHFNNMIKERDALIDKAKSSKDSSLMGYFQYALDVIANKEKL